MSSKPSASQLIAAVQASPAAVAAHDRGAWVALFASDGEVNDPVGSRPHRGREAIKHFYDAFIAPNTIAFKVDHDIVCGMWVVRDLTIDTTLAAGVTLPVPMHLRYELVREGRELKIRRLYAHWELLPMVRQMLGKGFGGISASMRLGLQVTRHLGIGGALGFSGGFAGVGGAGKRRVQAFLEAASAGDARAASAQLTADALLEWPGENPGPPTPLPGKFGGWQWRKLLAAGNFVTVSVGHPATGQHGVLQFEFDPRHRRICRVQAFIPH